MGGLSITYRESIYYPQISVGGAGWFHTHSNNGEV